MKYSRLITYTFICSVLTGSFVASTPSQAADFYFNPNYIISDEEMSDYTSMTAQEIEAFLRDKGSGLANKTVIDYDGRVMKASTLIWQAALESFINPKVLLTTLQKEQSLIEDPFPTRRRLDRAMGYRCPDSGSCNPKTLDFGKQVDGAAWQYRQYLDNPSSWNFRAGEQYLVDGYFITPVTTATAGLYNYTPHYSGNESFARIWQRYWGKNYRSGSLLKVSTKPEVWYIDKGMRRHITSYSVLVSRFDPNKIVTVTEADLKKYEIGSPIQFSNYSLLRTENGSIYLIVDDQKRHIANMEAFRQLGFNPDEVEQVSAVDLAGYETAEPLTVISSYPTGAVLQDDITESLYYAENGKRYNIIDQSLLPINYPTKVVTRVSRQRIDQLSDGGVAHINNGELVKSFDSPEVYVVEDGERYSIVSESVFAKYGYKWDNIHEVSANVLAAHPIAGILE